jgi:2-oxo-4-hydroxy-4-carboxy-5-ureidoimidazoline decarboxylase
MPTLAEINKLAAHEFVHTLGGVFEHSPWVAEAVEGLRPFDSTSALHAAMNGAVAASPLARHLDLIRAHPDLAGRLAQLGQLTAESTREQASAGLANADAATLARISELNSAYLATFGFPFIICARLNKVDTILEAMQLRLLQDDATEIATALSEIGKIALLRLKDLITD